MVGRPGATRASVRCRIDLDVPTRAVALENYKIEDRSLGAKPDPVDHCQSNGKPSRKPDPTQRRRSDWKGESGLLASHIRCIVWHPGGREPFGQATSRRELAVEREGECMRAKPDPTQCRQARIVSLFKPDPAPSCWPNKPVGVPVTPVKSCLRRAISYHPPEPLPME